MFSRVAFLGLVSFLASACSSTPAPQKDASTDATANDVTQEAAVVMCSTPGAACPTGGKCFFAVGNCGATMGVCADDSSCTGAPTESVCQCDGTAVVLPQCGPGGYALAKATNYGPCTSDAGAD
jgi:hypothetical protein